jgi:hypothetical protein
MLASDAIPNLTKEQLRAVAEKLDPLQLLDEVRTHQGDLVQLADGNSATMLPHRGADLDHFLKDLSIAWQDGEVRPTHQTAPSRRDTGERGNPSANDVSVEDCGAGMVVSGRS